MIAVVGGAKVSSKIDLLEKVIAKVDVLVVGGGMANTFFLAKGVAVGKSLAEPGLVDTANRIIAAPKGRLRDCAAGRRGGRQAIRRQCADGNRAGRQGTARRHDPP